MEILRTLSRLGTRAVVTHRRGDKVLLFTERGASFTGSLNPHAGRKGRGYFLSRTDGQMGKLRHEALQHLFKWHS